MYTTPGRWARQRLVAAAVVMTAFAGALFFSPVPARAHGAGVVKSCIQGTDCTSNSANNAVFAICNPLQANPAVECKPGRDVTIQVSNFGLGATVHLWWLNRDVDDPTTSDCSQAGVTNRTFLGDVNTSSTTGKGSLNVHLPPAGPTPGTWSYGSNWLCGTTVNLGQSGGVIGDQMFAIYPS